MFECKFTMRPQTYQYFFEKEIQHRIGYVSSSMFSHLSYNGSFMLMILSYDYLSYICLSYNNRLIINRSQMDQIRTEGCLKLHRSNEMITIGC